MQKQPKSQLERGIKVIQRTLSKESIFQGLRVQRLRLSYCSNCKCNMIKQLNLLQQQRHLQPNSFSRPSNALKGTLKDQYRHFPQNGQTSSTQPFPNDAVVEMVTLAIARRSTRIDKRISNIIMNEDERRTVMLIYIFVPVTRIDCDFHRISNPNMTNSDKVYNDKV